MYINIFALSVKIQSETFRKLNLIYPYLKLHLHYLKQKQEIRHSSYNALNFSYILL